MFVKDRDASTIRLQNIEALLKDERDPEKLYSFGMSCYRQKKLPEAKRLFMRACELKPDESRYNSYCGLLLALVDRKLKKAETLCQLALNKKATADLYYNLGRVYLMQAQREKALKVFHRGLQVDPRNMDIHRELENMGTRRRPVFPFLKRNNILNRIAGRIRNRMSKHRAVKSLGPAKIVR